MRGIALHIFIAVLCTRVNSAPAHVDEPFVGWKGESYAPQDTWEAPPGSGSSSRDNMRWIETISWSPRAFIYHNFLSEEEIKHMISLVEERVKPSQVVTDSGRYDLDPIRTSYGAAIRRGQDPVIASIEARIAEWTQLPASHGEPMQVLRYQNGQKYDAHWDWFADQRHSAGGDNRAATVLMYLGEVEEGGETALPLGNFIDKSRQQLDNPSDCVSKGTGLAVTPKRGDALLFWDMHPDGTEVDRSSLHASCPTLKGTKWTATKWIHNKPYGRVFDALKLAAECTDKSDDCSALVSAGKCDSDGDKLLGLQGICRKSCQDCIECAESDLICLRKNMRSLRGQLVQRAVLGADGNVAVA